MTRSKKYFLTASLVAAVSTAGAWAQAVSGVHNLPLYFEEVQGTGHFLAGTREGQVEVAAGGVQIASLNQATVQMQISGANPKAQIHGDSELAGKINYLTGNDPAQWRTGLATFSKIRVENVYPGINAVYYGNESHLEYDFDVSPGARPEAITLRFPAANKISVSPNGELAVRVGSHEIQQPKPVMYQTVAGARHAVQGGYKLKDAQTVAFAIGGYDHGLPLVIDPILAYASYLGGTGGEVAYAVAVNTNDGSIFMTGSTLSRNMATTNSVQNAYQGGQYFGDAFVAKFDRTGTNLMYFTYLGGDSEDEGLSIAVDRYGAASVCGVTYSPNFPTTANAISRNIKTPLQEDGYYNPTGFAAKLNTNGTSLIFSTYLGGSLEDAAYAVAVDQAANVYVTGYAASSDFPVAKAFQPTLACTNTYFNCNSFISIIASNGESFVSSTYFGGNNLDVGTGIAVDNSNCVYLTGYTLSTNFPTRYPFQPYWNSPTNQSFQYDAFVAKFTATATNLVYSSYIGGGNNDVANGIAVDNQGGAYVTGWTDSPGFYDTAAAIIPEWVNGNTNAINSTNVFLLKIVQPTPTSLMTIAYAALFGGNLIDIGYAVAVDAKGNAYVTGSARSDIFPVINTLGVLSQYNAGGDDAFVTVFNTNCTQVLFSSYLGGAGNDFGYGIALDGSGDAYVVGETASANFPVTQATPNFPLYTARVATLNGQFDAFLSKIQFNFTPSFTVKPVKPNLVSVSWLYNPAVDPDMAGHVLQATTNLATGNWVTITNVPTLSNNISTLTLPATGPQQFFRLYP